MYGNKVAPFIASYVDVRDVAAAHIRALELGDPSIHRFIVSSDAEAFRATEIGEIAQRQLPQYVTNKRKIVFRSLFVGQICAEDSTAVFELACSAAGSSVVHSVSWLLCAFSA